MTAQICPSLSQKSKSQSCEDVFRCSTLRMSIFQWDCFGACVRAKDGGLRQYTESQEKVHHISVGYNHKQQAAIELGNVMDTY